MSYVAGNILRSKISYISAGDGLALENVRRIREAFPGEQASDVSNIEMEPGRGVMLEVHAGQKLKDVVLEWHIYGYDGKAMPQRAESNTILLKGVDVVVICASSEEDARGRIATIKDAAPNVQFVVQSKSNGPQFQIDGATCVVEDAKTSAMATMKAAMKLCLTAQK
jgi:hypothetical protein